MAQSYNLLKAGDWSANTAKSTPSSYMFLFAIIFGTDFNAGGSHSLFGGAGDRGLAPSA